MKEDRGFLYRKFFAIAHSNTVLLGVITGFAIWACFTLFLTTRRVPLRRTAVIEMEMRRLGEAQGEEPQEMEREEPPKAFLLGRRTRSCLHFFTVGYLLLVLSLIVARVFNLYEKDGMKRCREALGKAASLYDKQFIDQYCAFITDKENIDQICRIRTAFVEREDFYNVYPNCSLVCTTKECTFFQNELVPLLRKRALYAFGEFFGSTVDFSLDDNYAVFLEHKFPYIFAETVHNGGRMRKEDIKDVLLVYGRDVTPEMEAIINAAAKIHDDSYEVFDRDDSLKRLFELRGVLTSLEQHWPLQTTPFPPAPTSAGEAKA